MNQGMNSDLTQDDKLWALLSWIIWPIAVIVLFMDEKKNRPFIKYNAPKNLTPEVVNCLDRMTIPWTKPWDTEGRENEKARKFLLYKHLRAWVQFQRIGRVSSEIT